MIGRLQGQIVERDLQQLLLDVGGVSYEVAIPLSTYYQIGDAEGPVTVYTHLVVKDDAHLLYGFATKQERDLFRALITVKGVGPKTGLSIMSGLETGDLARAIVAEDKGLLAGIPGVSARIATQMILDLNGKLDEFVTGEAASAVSTTTDVAGDVEAALINLGYRPQEAARAIAQVEDPAEDVETLIRQALKQLVQS